VIESKVANLGKKEMSDSFDRVLYDQRNMVEAVFSLSNEDLEMKLKLDDLEFRLKN